MSGSLQLSGESLAVEIDPGRGADVLSIIDLSSGVELLFSTPWRERADAIRAGALASTSGDSVDSWMEQYRGGWQTLCPNAGPPRDYRGATLGFHGEASIVPWTLTASDSTSARLVVDLFTVPLRIERSASVAGSTFSLVDTLTNTSDLHLVVDYSNHLAFGGDFLGDACRVDTNASTFVPDPGANADGFPVAWPAPDDDGSSDLRELPGPGARSSRFGWLSGFPGGGNTAAWASVTNPHLGLTASISWDPSLLPYAWWWQEFNNAQDFPWFGQARVFAIEPASTQTSGPDRASVMTIPPRGSVRVPVRLSVDSVNEMGTYNE